MEKERYDAEVCGSGISVEFSEASTSESAWSVTSPRAHQQNSTRCLTPVLSLSPSISSSASPAPPPESTLWLKLTKTHPLTLPMRRTCCRTTIFLVGHRKCIRNHYLKLRQFTLQKSRSLQNYFHSPIRLLICYLGSLTGQRICRLQI